MSVKVSTYSFKS